MNTENYFETFEKYKSCLDVKTSDLRYLSSLNIMEMIEDDNLVYVTPILNKMASFSLSYKYIDIDYLKDFAFNNKSYYDQVNELSKACCDYLNHIYDAGCLHPSIKKYNALDEGVASYENMLDAACDIRYKLYKTENVLEFDKFYYNTLQKTIDIDEKYQEEMIKELNNTQDFKAFNIKMSFYAFLYTMRKLLLADRNDQVTYSYNFDADAGRIIRRSGSEISLAFTDLMINLSRIKDNYEEPECLDEIDDILDFYKQYNSYQNSYIKNACRENKILSLVKTYK